MKKKRKKLKQKKKIIKRVYKIKSSKKFKKKTKKAPKIKRKKNKKLRPKILKKKTNFITKKVKKESLALKLVKFQLSGSHSIEGRQICSIDGIVLRLEGRRRCVERRRCGGRVAVLGKLILLERSPGFGVDVLRIWS